MCLAISPVSVTGFDAMRGLITLLLLVVPTMLVAETDVTEDSAMRLTVKPVLCITDKRTPICEISFLIHWQSGSRGYYCLSSDLDQNALRCWSDENTGQMTDDRSVREDFSYWMTADADSSRLAAVTVEVLRMDTDDRRRQRRTRHVWDIN